jgi:methylglyoxal reductase
MEGLTMNMIKLGKKDTAISRIGLGTWAIGGGPAWGGDADFEESIRTIAGCKSLGINLVDTAPAYNFGNSEKIVGAALARIRREDVILITKCGITWKGTGSLFNKVGDTQLYKNLSKASIKDEISESLDRLGTGYIDVYMTHWQSVEPFFTPVSETMEALNELKADGIIRAIGAANVTASHIDEYLKYGDLDIVQCKYSILDRKVEQEILPLCEKRGITFQAYSPLEQGLLTGTIGDDYVPPKGSAQNGKRWFERDNMRKALAMLRGWSSLRARHTCSIPDLAIAWILAQGRNITVLSGAVTMDQLAENAKAADIRLTDADILAMRDAAEALDC